LGTQGSTPGVLASQHLFAVEITPIGKDRDLPVSCRLLRSECHRYELCSVMTHIGHVVRNNQVVLGVYCGLYVITDDSSAFAAGRH
jgi:hypothetical protein